MTRDPEAEWRPDPAGFPEAGTDDDRLRYLLGFAILAPSGHNTQPWLFRIRDGALDVLADRTRALPVVDPNDRALAISCGAAIGMLREAGRRFGREVAIALAPDPHEPDLLAQVRLNGPYAGDDGVRARFAAITRRRSTRMAYAPEPLPDALRDELEWLARDDRIELALIVEPDRKAAIGGLIAEGDRVQFANPSFRRELAAWVHSRRARSRDGMSGAAFGMPDVLSGFGGLVIRTFDMGDGIAAKDAQIAAGSPALAIVATPGDGPRDWLSAGIAHARLLLEVTAAGLTAAYLNQPIEVDALRPRLRGAAGLKGWPQVLFRVGKGPHIAPAIRRPVAEVLIT